MHPAQDSVQKAAMTHSASLSDTLPKSCFYAKSLCWKALNVLTAIGSLNTEGHLTTARHLSAPYPVSLHLTKEKHIVMIHRVWLHLSSLRTHVKLRLGDTAKADLICISILYVVALTCLERVIFVV